MDHKTGRFKGWLPRKSFGFIEVKNEDDVFVHKSAVPDSEKLTKGSVVEFDIQETEKGLQAANLRIIATVTAERRPRHPDFPERRLGQVNSWIDRGFGFITPESGGRGVFVHKSTLTDNKSYLREGDEVEFDTGVGDEGGPVAFNVRAVGWSKTGVPISDFADLGHPSWANKLKNLAEDEEWDYRHTKSSQSLPILRSYFRYTFHRLSEMPNGISYSEGGKYASTNTGLVTPNQEEIYAVFSAASGKVGPQWLLKGFFKASDRLFINKFGGSPPPLAEYFENPADLLFDRRCELYISIDHVLDRIERFPDHLRDNVYMARQLLLSAEAQTKKRVYRNYKTAIPQFFRESGGEGHLQLLLPICLENPAKADLALTVEKNEAGDAYRSSTVLTLDMAYNNARLLARPDTEWLQP